MGKFNSLCHHDLHLVLYIRHLRNFNALTSFYNTLAMGNSCACPDENRSIELIRNLVGCLNKIKTFLAVTWFKHRNLGGYGVMAAVLLVL